MNFVDRTIARLADETTRAALFDEASLEHILESAYDTTSTPVNGPFSAVFDEFTVGFHAPHLSHGKGQIFTPGAAPVDVALQLSDLPATGTVSTDGYWRGAIIARSAPDNATIVDVRSRWPSLAAIDAAVAGSNGGSLPEDPVILEMSRRAELIELLRNGLSSPEAIDDDAIEQLLYHARANSVAELLAAGATAPGTLGVTFSPAPDPAPTPQSYPLRAVLLVIDEGFSLQRLLSDSKALRSRLSDRYGECAREASLGFKHALAVVWLLPQTVFDDPDWPGASEGMDVEQARAARRNTARQWLAREGIGLVPVA